MEWRAVKYIDDDVGDDWRGRYASGRVVKGRGSVNAMVAGWNVMRPLVISRPGSRNFFPVMNVREYSRRAFRSARKSQRMMILLALVYFFISVAFWYIEGNEKSVSIVLASLSMVLYLSLDYLLVVSRFDVLKERASFIVYVHKHGKIDAWVWVTLAVVIGAAQYFMQKHYGGFEPMMYTWGLVYDSVNDGELWRFITGPFFHSGIPHWIANAVMLVFIAPLVGVVSRADGVVVFLLGNVVGSLVAWLHAYAGLSDRGALVGISGGISAMMGWLVGFSMVYKKEMPQMLAASILIFFIFSQLLVLMMYPRVSIVAHIGGFFLGAAWAATFKRKSMHEFRPSPE